MCELTIDSVPIARGASGIVYNGRLNVVDMKVAIKSLTEGYNIVALVREAIIWQSLDHPRITKLLGITMNGPRISFVMPLYTTNLGDFIDKGPMSVLTAHNIVLQVAEGMCYLHARTPAIFHRDLKR